MTSVVAYSYSDTNKVIYTQIWLNFQHSVIDAHGWHLENLLDQTSLREYQKAIDSALAEYHARLNAGLVEFKNNEQHLAFVMRYS